MSTKHVWKHKDLIGTEHLSAGDIDSIFITARSLKKTMAQNEVKKLDSLVGKSIVHLFLEPSTRTRVSFEVAAKRLGADIILINDTANTSLVKGESLRDTAMNIRALGADLIVLRHSAPGAVDYLSRILDVPVINAGDGAHEHPTQALVDCFTLNERWDGKFKGKKVTILGDILFSRVARSNIWALTKLGAEVTLVGPRTLVPKDFEKIANVRVSHDLKSALEDADAVMLLRIQHERRSKVMFPSLGEYTAMFGLNKQRASWLKKDALIMHPGPINRGVEIDSDLADSEHSIILDQVSNGVAVRMAALYLCSSAATSDHGVELMSL